MKAALGKGLDSLMPEKGREIIEVELSRIAADTNQPRKIFKDDSLKELSDSIREKGVLQPVILKRRQEGGFSLIAGERRYRAAHLAGLKKIPAIVRDSDAEDTLEVALIENIQREDLGPMETAAAFDRLMKQFNLTQESMAVKVGKDRATVANYLRLLTLPSEIKDLLNNGSLSMGHARSLLALQSPKDMIEAARKIVSLGLSVREAEAIAKKKPKAAKPKSQKMPEIGSLEEKLKKALGTKVFIKTKGASGKSGSVVIEYYSLEELERLLDILLK